MSWPHVKLPARTDKHCDIRVYIQFNIHFVFYYQNVFQISSNHTLLHPKVLDLLIRLFESSFDELDVLVRVSDFNQLNVFKIICLSFVWLIMFLYFIHSFRL